MDEGSFNLDINKTLKVSGVSRFLKEQLEKEFQKKSNTTGFHDDVNKLYVCPQGQDYVLIEFAKDLPPGNFKTCIVHYSALNFA